MTIPEVSMHMEDVGVLKIRTSEDCAYLIHHHGEGLQITQLSDSTKPILVEQRHLNQIVIRRAT